MFSRARYFTFTGKHLAQTPTDIHNRQVQLITLHSQVFASRPVLQSVEKQECSGISLGQDEVIEKALNARNGAKFGRLWSGSWQSDYPSQSEADLALCCLLAFWTDLDRARMDMLFRRSGMMRKKWLRKGYREKTMEQAIASTNQTWSAESRDRNGLAVALANRVSQSSRDPHLKWDPPLPFHQFDLPEFPTQVLPDWLRSFVEAHATASQTPVDIAGMLALAVISTACAKKVAVRIREDWMEPVNIYIVTALASGNRKSGVFRVVAEPLNKFSASEAERMAPELAKSVSTYRIKESQLKRAQEQASAAEPGAEKELVYRAGKLAAELSEMEILAPSRLVVSDCTPEKLGIILRQQRGRIAIMSAEGEIFELMAGRYSAAKEGNFEILLKGHAGDSLEIDRVGRPPELINDPAITIGLTVQLAVIQGLVQKSGFRGRGLIARLLFSLPVSLLGRRDTNPPPVPDAVRESYNEHVLALLTLPWRLEKNGARHQELHLDNGAQDRLQRFEAWIEPQLGEFGDLGYISDWAGKLVGAVARIVGILHMATHADSSAPWEIPISADTVEGAVTIGMYLIPHAKAAFNLMGGDPSIEHAKFILRWINHHHLTSFSKRDLHQGVKGTIKKIDDLDKPLMVITDHGFVRQRTDPAPTGPGRKPSPTFDVNPLWDRNGLPRTNSENCENSEKRTLDLIKDSFCRPPGDPTKAVNKGVE